MFEPDNVLERGIMRNGRMFTGVFERIFQKVSGVDNLRSVGVSGHRYYLVWQLLTSVV